MAGTITAMVVQKRNKERVNIYIDGEFSFGLAMIEAIKLRKGQSLTDSEIERLRALDEIEVAHESALRFLSYRPRSVSEVQRQLQDKEFSPESIDAVIERLKGIQLLDDEAFARFWVENREQFDPRSIQSLKSELRRKGVGEDEARVSLEEVDEDEAAYRAGKAKVRRYQKDGWQTFRKRLGDFLLRRGFSYGVVRQAVKRLWEEYASQNQPNPDGESDDFDSEMGE